MNRTYFEQELIRRIQKNPRYSLRAFAKALGVSHTALSLVMAGKRPPSRRLLERLANNMSLSPEETQQLMSSSGKAHLAKDAYTQIDMDTFHLISDWLDYAILSLLELPTSRFEPAWISQRLSVSKTEAKLAMERLQRLNLVANQDGRVRQVPAPIVVENTIATAASRKFHHSLLGKALEALDNQSMADHDFSSVTFAMDLKHVPYARQKIRAFRRKLVSELEAMAPPSHVVNLTVQIFPVSH